MTRHYVRKSSILLSFSVFVLLSVAVIAAERRNDHIGGVRVPADGARNNAPLVLRLISRVRQDRHGLVRIRPLAAAPGPDSAVARSVDR